MLRLLLARPSLWVAACRAAVPPNLPTMLGGWSRVPTNPGVGMEELGILGTSAWASGWRCDGVSVWWLAVSRCCGDGFPLLLIGDVVACGVALCLIFELEGLLSGRCALPALDGLCVSVSYRQVAYYCEVCSSHDWLFENSSFCTVSIGNLLSQIQLKVLWTEEETCFMRFGAR
jgi:hypothetical protein